MSAPAVKSLGQLFEVDTTQATTPAVAGIAAPLNTTAVAISRQIRLPMECRSHDQYGWFAAMVSYYVAFSGHMRARRFSFSGTKRSA